VVDESLSNNDNSVLRGQSPQIDQPVEN